MRAWPDKLLVFTRFRATQEYLAGVLREAGEPLALYHGALRRAEKEAAVHAFEGPARILLSTEAAGEGRNLQFAPGIVNYDLPWNPMRIEQRIGRLSRVGQTRGRPSTWSPRAPSRSTCWRCSTARSTCSSW